MAVRNKQKNHHLRVLLVDDNENGLAARKMLLEELGLETVGVNSPKKALEAMEGGEFDLVVTDYQMPGLNGTQLIAAMRARGVQAPVIMVSGYVEALSLTEKSTGANLVIAKSAHEVAALLRGVKRLLPGSPMRKPAGRTGAKPKHRSASA
jgi:CheY-like chemotaxis protein